MSDLNKILKKLGKIGFSTVYNSGSKAKLYPPDNKMPFYSLHVSGEQKAIFPLKRFAKKNWNLDLDAI